MRAFFATALCLLAATAFAEEQPEILEARKAQVGALRLEIAGQIQLQAYDLLDELVYGWTQQPPFTEPTALVLADVSVPVGFSSGFQAGIENHFASVLLKNPRTNVVLSHCPACTSLIVRSGAKGTIVSRGADEPEALRAAGVMTGSRHALFLDFEAEGMSLVLRARMTSLEPSLPIVFARTLSTAANSAALLRSPDRLKSAEEARQEYLDALAGRGMVLVPVKLGVRTYAAGENASVGIPPFIWLTAGVDIGLTQARAWTGSLAVGASWLPQLQSSFLAQARVARMLTGSVSSLTRPDVYGFGGIAVINVRGQGARLFSLPEPNLQEAMAAVVGSEPQATFAAIQMGLEARVKNRVGVAVFIEGTPSLLESDLIGRYINFGPIQAQSFGAEVSFWF